MEKKKLDVLMISGSFPPQRGGVASHVYYLTQALTRVTKGRWDTTKVCGVEVLTGSGEAKAEGVPDRIRFFTVYRKPFDAEIDGMPFSSGGSAPYLKTIHFAQKHWLKRRPDVVHAHDLESAYIGWMLKTAFGVPLVVTIHKTPKEWDEEAPKRDPKDCFLGAMLKGDWADKLVAPSSAYADRLHAQGFAEHRVTKILHGVPVKWLSSHAKNPKVLERFQLQKSDQFVLCPSRIDEHKGIDTLIGAAKILRGEAAARDLVYVVAGGGPKGYRDKLWQDIIQNGLQDFVRLGPIDGGDCDLVEMATLYKTAVACVIPSKREGFGQAVLEAFVFRSPVVAANTGGLPEIVAPKDGDRLGLLFHRDEAGDLASQLLQVLADKNGRNERIARALAVVKEQFSADRMAHDYFALYCRVAGVTIK